MKNFIFVFIIFFFLGITPSAESRPNPGNGYVREYHPNGKLRLELRFKKEQLIRKRAFYKNGEPFFDYEYRNGQLIRRRFFHENGRLKSLWTQDSNETRFYESNGELKTVVGGDQERELRSSYIFSQ
ncbi:MAG: hypothetical protein NUV91_03810 [Candidatus Omnitrophica bacterium]|nr:hypothetical protein [Candidatus Omnitrophota bacterium]